MKKKLALIKEFLRLSIRQSLIYRGSWILGVIGQFFNYSASILSLYILIDNFGDVQNWNSSEIMFMYALALLAYALAASFLYGPCMMLPGSVKDGLLDQTLTKPMDSLCFEILYHFNIGYISHIILGLTVLIVSLLKMHIHMTPFRILFLIVMIISGAMIEASILLLSSILSFVMMNGNPIFDFIVYDGRSLINYPISIYPTILQFILTFLVPYAFINYYPTIVLLNRHMGEVKTVFGYMTPVIGFILLVISVKAWKYSLRHYESSGS